jgi:signal transduction histidine kinase
MSISAAGLPHIQSKATDDDVRQQLSALAATLLERRDAILAAWRAADDAAPERSAGASLSRVQFNDHVPAVLDCLAHTIKAWPDGHPLAGENGSENVCEHGLQRWQQGYQLRELIREWGHLQMAVGDELERYEATHPDLDRRVMPVVRRAWAQLCADSVTQSATQYWRLHQSESAGHVNHLEQALAALHTIEQDRAEAWRRAAHDLRGSVTVVKGATTLLSGDGEDALPEVMRVEVAEMLTKSVASLHDMLNDLLSLARLEAGQEQRELTTFDAATVLRDFCTASQAAAAERGLFLKMEGPSALPVQGDKAKVTRILQNLLLNALKYTQKGGVSVTWGLDKSRDTDRWTFSVQDTGPGIDEAVAAPLAQDLHRATAVSNDAKETSTDRRREIDPAATLASASNALPECDQPGEGVGLSIVKRLCELLDSGLELATESGRGSTFRVILPRSYDESV